VGSQEVKKGIAHVIFRLDHSLIETKRGFLIWKEQFFQKNVVASEIGSLELITDNSLSFSLTHFYTCVK